MSISSQGFTSPEPITLDTVTVKADEGLLPPPVPRQGASSFMDGFGSLSFPSASSQWRGELTEPNVSNERRIPLPWTARFASWQLDDVRKALTKAFPQALCLDNQDLIVWTNNFATNGYFIVDPSLPAAMGESGRTTSSMRSCDEFELFILETDRDGRKLYYYYGLFRCVAKRLSELGPGEFESLPPSTQHRILNRFVEDGEIMDNAIKALRRLRFVFSQFNNAVIKRFEGPREMTIDRDIFSARPRSQSEPLSSVRELVKPAFQRVLPNAFRPNMMQQPELSRARHRPEDSQPVIDVSVGGPLRKKTRIERTMEQKQVRRERKKAKQHSKQAWQTLTSSGSSSGILTVKVEAPEVNLSLDGRPRLTGRPKRKRSPSVELLIVPSGSRSRRPPRVFVDRWMEDVPL